MNPPKTPSPSATNEQHIADTVEREQLKLGNFIRRRVRDPTDADDILQDVFQEFIEACRLPAPIEQASAWLFRVARNRIIDRFRKHKETSLDDVDELEDDDHYRLDLMLPSSVGGPEAAYTRQLLLQQLHKALEALPANQREVFIAHELEGISFKDMAAQSGVPVNTLLGRKRYAVLFLRTQLQDFYND